MHGLGTALPGEVGNDDGYGEGDHEYAGEGAHGPNDLADPSRRNHVPIPENNGILLSMTIFHKLEKTI